MNLQAWYRKSSQANKTAVSTVHISTLSGPRKGTKAKGVGEGFHRMAGPDGERYHFGDMILVMYLLPCCCLCFFCQGFIDKFFI